jgi:hypothetical protein
MDPAILLRVDPTPDGAWEVWLNIPSQRPLRARVEPSALRALPAQLAALHEPPPVATPLRGPRDAARVLLEESVGRTLAQVFSAGPGFGAELARVKALARKQPYLLAVDSDHASVRELPWELLCATPTGQPLEVSNEAVVVRLGTAGAPPRPQPAWDLAVRTWTPDPEDRVVSTLLGRVDEGVRKAGWPAPRPVGEAWPHEDDALVVILVGPAHKIAPVLDPSTVAAALEEEDDTPALYTLLRRADLVVLLASDQGKTLAIRPEEWAARVLKAGAQAVVVASGPVRMEASAAFCEGLFAGFAEAGALPGAVAAARKSVRAFAHPAPDGRWSRWQLTVGAVHKGPALVKRPLLPPGWPKPSAEAMPLFRQLRSLFDKHDPGFVGVEHLLLAWGEVSPRPATERLIGLLRGKAPAVRSSLAWYTERTEAEAGSRWTLRMLRLSGSLEADFSLDALWKVLLSEAGYLLRQVLDQPQGGVTTDTMVSAGWAPPATSELATGLEILGGPEDGRKLYPKPGDVIGRYNPSAPCAQPLYGDTAATDPALSRGHLQWVEKGWLDPLKPVAEAPRGGRLLLRLGEVRRITPGTTVIGIAPRKPDEDLL